MFSIGDYASVESSRFNNKLNIENVYSEPFKNNNMNNNIYSIPEHSKSNGKWIKTEDTQNTPEYSVIDLSKKYEERLKKNKLKEQQEIGDEKINKIMSNLNIYEDIDVNPSNGNLTEERIYERV